MEGQCVAKRAATAERGLEAAKPRQAETKAKLWISLANTEVALRESFAALEPEQAALVSAKNALELARKARSEVD